VCILWQWQRDRAFGLGGESPCSQPACGVYEWLSGFVDGIALLVKQEQQLA